MPGLKKTVVGALPDDFDPAAYLELHPDVRAAGVDAARHYLEHGRAEGRRYRPGPNDAIERALAAFLTLPPSDQNAFDLFPGAWSSSFDGVETGGTFDATRDPRIDWLLTQTDLTGRKVLELGPLEGGHTCMLERAGAEVLAIEANKGAFLRCLIAKNHLGLRARFLLGDFEKLDLSGERFDVVVASGVLYHMKDPAALLCALAPATERLFLWTHYFEPDLSKWNPALAQPLAQGKWDVRAPVTVEAAGGSLRMVRQSYREALGWTGFCGGTDSYSHWIHRADLLALLGRLGFATVRVAFDHVDHRNGPAFCLYCEKQGGGAGPLSPA